MRLTKILAAGAAIALAATPAMAQSANVPLAARDGAELSAAEELGGGGFLVPALAVIAIILGILAATSGSGSDDLPVSP